MKQIAACLLLLVLLPVPAWAGDAEAKSQRALISLFSTRYSVWRSKTFIYVSDQDFGPKITSKSIKAAHFIYPNFDLFAPEPVDGSAPGAELVSYGCPAAKDPGTALTLRQAISHDKEDSWWLMGYMGDIDAPMGWAHIPFGDHVKLVAVPTFSSIQGGKHPKEWFAYTGQAKVTWRGRDLWCPVVCLGRSLPPGKSAFDLRLTDEALRSKLGR